MSRAFVKDDDTAAGSEELPERPVSTQPNYVTARGLAQLRRRQEEMLARHAQLKQAAEAFDRPEIARLERDLRYVAQRVDTAQVVEPGSRRADEVHFGATVGAREPDGTLLDVTIVGEDEADVAQGLISWDSPLGLALLGAQVGDTVRWRRPAGEVDLEVASIAYVGL